MSSANLVRLGYVLESVLGTTPSNPALKEFRFTRESLNYSIDNVVSEQIRSDRTESDTVQVSADAAGDIGFELSYGSHDDWLEAVLGGTWTTVSGNIANLLNGVIVRGFTVQKHFSDIQPAPGLFHNYRGVIPNSMSLNFEVGQIVTGAFGCLAFGSTQANAQIAGATTPAAPTTKPFNAVVDFQNFNIDGVPYSGCINSLTMNIANNFRAIKCIGSIFSTDMIPGSLQITGNMNLYFKDGTMYDKYISGLEFSFSFRMTDAAGNMLTFFVPRAKFESADVVAGGRNTDVMINATYRALYNVTNTCVLKVTRDAAS